MEILADYDPLTGHRCILKIEDGKLHIRNEQDPTKYLESALKLRNDTNYTKRGIKEDNWHYARVPDDVQLEMLQKYGVNMVNPPFDWEAIFACINTHYPYLKTTEKNHA